MPQTVYIDVLFFVNFILDAMIFLSAATLLRQRIRWWRTCVAAAVGALCSCGMFFSAIAPWLINVLALLLYILCAYIVFGFHGVKPFVKNSLITVVCAFVYGGIAFALYLYTGAGAVMTFNNGALYIDIPVFTLLLFAFVAYGAIWLVRTYPEMAGAKGELRSGNAVLWGTDALRPRADRYGQRAARRGDGRACNPVFLPVCSKDSAAGTACVCAGYASDGYRPCRGTVAQPPAYGQLFLGGGQRYASRPARRPAS